jgi:integrase
VFADTKITLTQRNIKLALEDFIRHCKLSATSINIILAGIDTFLNLSSDEEQKYIPKKNHVKKYKPPLPNKIKPPYTEEEYLMFVEHFEKRGNKEMSLFLQFLWETGARSKESINIKISDIDFEKSYIKISNKLFKGQEETLLLSSVAMDIVKQIIVLEKGKDGRLFSWKYTGTPRGNLERLENKLDIKIRGRGLHGFRRSFSDKLFNSGFDTPDIQEATRHRSIVTTIKHYKTFNKTKLIEKMNEKLK